MSSFYRAWDDAQRELSQALFKSGPRSNFCVGEVDLESHLQHQAYWLLLILPTPHFLDSSHDNRLLDQDHCFLVSHQLDCYVYYWIDRAQNCQCSWPFQWHQRNSIKTQNRPTRMSLVPGLPAIFQKHFDCSWPHSGLSQNLSTSKWTAQMLATLTKGHSFVQYSATNLPGSLQRSRSLRHVGSRPSHQNLPVKRPFLLPFLEQLILRQAWLALSWTVASHRVLLSSTSERNRIFPLSLSCCSNWHLCMSSGAQLATAMTDSARCLHATTVTFAAGH